ncbi:transcriptional protein SWT1-like [Pecten maximus]|uniref:transcriptional protein SWT1-like n=1 Tax=Pecten maximus TaxID=6579 RepID=UPI0014583410|nr:transcriptional protein SWT1-like [Pecten maximus]
MKVAYDDIWMDIVYRKPPWTLEDILDCFKKHWIAVFGMIYSRKLKEEVHRLVEKFKPFKGFTPSLENVGELVDDAMNILEECEVHSNYGLLFSEAFAELKQVQKFQRECVDGTVSGTSLETYLKRKTISKSKKRLSLDSDGNTSQPLRPDSVTPPSMASSHTSPHVSDDGVVCLQPVEDRFRTIWQTILNLCDTMKTWVESSAKEHLQEMNDTLSKLVPFVKDLRYQFEYTLSFSPTQIKSQQAYVHNMCIKLNTFFSTMELQDSCEPVEVEQVQLYFASEERRTMLKAGLRQLDDMIRSLFTFLHLLPD